MNLSLRTSLLIAACCSALAFAGGVFLASPGKGSGTAQITTKRISGAPIAVGNWDVKGSSFRFTTTAEGSGVAETTVPKAVIPEARAYIERRHTVSVLCGSLMYDRSLDPFAGGAYLFRDNNFFAGGGLFGSRCGILGLFAEASYMF